VESVAETAVPTAAAGENSRIEQLEEMVLEMRLELDELKSQVQRLLNEP